MYIYSFTRFGGFDKVFRMSDDKTGGCLKMKIGDLLQLGSEFFLCLGEKVSFGELYANSGAIQNPSLEVVYPKFLSAEAVQLLHRMVETYYTTYKSVIKLFVSDEVEKLLEREGKIKDKRGKMKDENKDTSLIHNLGSFICASEGQTLIVFPDLWTMTNSSAIADSNGGLKIENGELSSTVILLASNTQNQKDIHRWEIKKGLKSVILCTYGEIFQDFHDLKKIIFVDPHKRYYANQQDPRYKVGEVLAKMAQISGAEMETAGI